jgi:hypothetical protein
MHGCAKDGCAHIYMYKDIDICIKVCGFERYSSAYDTVPDHNLADGYADDRYPDDGYYDRHTNEPEQRSCHNCRAGSGGSAVRAVECR